MFLDVLNVFPVFTFISNFKFNDDLFARLNIQGSFTKVLKIHVLPLYNGIYTVHVL